MSDSSKMALASSLYKTNHIRAVLLGTGGWEQVIESNPNRLYLNFWSYAGASFNYFLAPSPVPPFFPAVWISTPIQEWKFKDCPSIVTGEFYALGTAGTEVFATECVYIGR